MVDVAAEAGIPVETLRKIETGRIATPAFFTIAALARTLNLAVDVLADQTAAPHDETSIAATA